MDTDDSMERLPPTTINGDTPPNNGQRLPQVHYVNADHLSGAFSAMNLMRQSGQLCDVQLLVTGGGNGNGHPPIPAHRVVLASASAYFNAMFNSEMAERHKPVVELRAVDASAVQLLIDYAYTGEVMITEDNVQSLLPAASLLQVSPVREACCQFLLRQLHPSNCLGIRSFADAHFCEQLQRSSHNYALSNFQEVAATDEFLLLTVEEIENLIASDELNIGDEESCFEAVMRWIRNDVERRNQHLDRLLQHVRLPLIKRSFLLSRVSDDQLVRTSRTGKDLLIEAMKYHLSPEQRCSLSGVRTERRRPVGLESYLLAVGGGSLFAIHNECECYNPRTDRWSSVAPTLQRRSRAGVVTLDRVVYAVGGYNGTKDLSSGEFFDPVENRWTAITNMGTKRSCLGVAALNGLIYVAGGYDGASCLNSVERFDPLVATWSSVQAMETRRRYCRLAVLDGCLFAIGGYDGSNYQSSMERLDPREGKWQLMPSMMNRRSSCGVATLDNKLYVVGGNDGSLCMCSVERFDPLRNSWEPVGAMNSRRSTHEVVAVDRWLFAVGGNDGSSSLNTVERFDPDDNKWMLVAAMTLRRSSVGAAVIQCPEFRHPPPPQQTQPTVVVPVSLSSSTRTVDTVGQLGGSPAASTSSLSE